MKKQTNVEIIQQAYADFLAGNFAAVTDQCTDDVKWGSFDNRLFRMQACLMGSRV